MSSSAAVTGKAFRSTSLDVEMAILIAGLAATAAATESQAHLGAAPSGQDFTPAFASLFVAPGFTLVDGSAAPAPAPQLASPEADVNSAAALASLYGQIDAWAWSAASPPIPSLLPPPGTAAPAGADLIFLSAVTAPVAAAGPAAFGHDPQLAGGDLAPIYLPVIDPAAAPASLGSAPPLAWLTEPMVGGAALLPVPEAAQSALFGLAALTGAVAHGL